MKESIEKLIGNLYKEKAPEIVVYSSLLAKIDFQIDKDFIEFIKMYNGAEGDIGSNKYLSLWNVQQLIDSNPYYNDVKECEELFFFGTDGSNLGYAFEKNESRVVRIDFWDISQIEPDYIAINLNYFYRKCPNNNCFLCRFSV